MKVEIKQNEKEKGKDVFPHLGIYYDGMIVLFVARNIGIRISSGGRSNIGMQGEGWNEDYELFTGEITLSND